MDVDCNDVNYVAGILLILFLGALLYMDVDCNDVN